MNLSDPIASMLTAIRNSNMRKYRKVVFPFSYLKWEICQKLKQKSFLSNCLIKKKNKKKPEIEIIIKYSNQKSKINQIKVISKPSQHVHIPVKKIKKYCWKYGIYIISTSLPNNPLLTQWEALKNNQGGKVLFFIN